MYWNDDNIEKIYRIMGKTKRSKDKKAIKKNDKKMISSDKKKGSKK